MNDRYSCSTYRRNPLIALFLSLVLPGTGHVYCGRMGIGLGFVFLSSVSIPTVAGALSYLSPVSPILLFLGFCVIGAVVLAAAVHAAVLARRTGPDYLLKDYNRWYIYLLLILIGTGSSLGFALHAKNKYLEAFVVPSNSMFPTIVGPDRILANKAAYKREDVKRGDIILFANPENPRIFHTDRVVAIAGDTIEIRDSALYVNGRKLLRETVAPDDLPWCEPECQRRIFHEHNSGKKYKIMLSEEQNNLSELPSLLVPENHCYVLGDNRHNAKDSRYYGPIPMVAVRGRIDYIYAPARSWSRFGRIDGD